METFISDIEQIAKKLGTKFESAWLFGSMLEDSVSAKDIDIAIKLLESEKWDDNDKDSLNEFSSKVKRISVDSYGGSPTRINSAQKYDLVILANPGYSEYFFNRNKALRIL